MIAAYSGALAVGDVVYCRSGTANQPYIALVTRERRDTVTCRWFYRYSDLPKSLAKRKKGRGGVAASQARKKDRFNHPLANGRMFALTYTGSI